MKRIAIFLGIALGVGAAAWILLPRLRAPAPGAPASPSDFCEEHGVPESECGICHPELLGGGSPAPCQTEKVRIRLASPEVADQVGIETAAVEPGPLKASVAANGRVAFHAGRTARVSSPIPGVIREVLKDLGQEVEAGEALFVVESPELGEAQSAFLQAAAAAGLAEKEAGREHALLERGATSQKELLASEAALQDAQAALSRAGDRLRILGLSEGGIAALRESRAVSSRLTVAAPLSGTVVDRAGAVGEAVDPSRPVLTVSDLSRVWVVLDLFEKEIGRVAVGQRAVFVADAYPDRVFEGTLTWISASVDPESRTLPARMEVSNPERLLRANFFGRAEITVREEGSVLVIPKDAVQWEGCHHVVFVPAGEGQYQTRKVELGWTGAGACEITAGLLPGERVVTTGSFLLKTEILKGSIGAG